MKNISPFRGRALNPASDMFEQLPDFHTVYFLRESAGTRTWGAAALRAGWLWSSAGASPGGRHRAAGKSDPNGFLQLSLSL